MTLAAAVVSLRSYADSGRPTGGFLRAVLENDLMEAVGRADHSSLVNLADICRYVYNDIPAPCHGSPEKVSEWLQMHAEKRLAVAAERGGA